MIFGLNTKENLIMANNKRTNSWTVANFVNLLNNAASAYFGVSQNERISNIRIINNTVVITIEPKPIRQTRGRR